MILVYNDEPYHVVTDGDLVKCFRGDNYIVTGWREPHKIGSTGRVYVKEFEGDGTAEYFPSVFEMKFSTI